MYGPGQGQNQVHGRGGGPGVNHMPLGGNRGSFMGGRGGNVGGRGRGMGMNRGAPRGGRGGMYNNMGGRGGGHNQGGGSFRGHGPSRGFGNRDNRRGGSFNAGGGQSFSHGHQQQQPQQPQQNFSGTFRRNQGFSASVRGGRHDSAVPHGPKDSAVPSGPSSSKKEENRRTLTDFKIVGLEIKGLAWCWGTVPKASIEPVVKEEIEEDHVAAPLPDTQAADENTGVEAESAPDVADLTPKASMVDQPAAVDGVDIKTETQPVTLPPPPPSRIRIYFHTPVTADDSHPLSAQSSLSLVPSSDPSMRKGKRKKLDDDDDGDIEDGRGLPPPPPQHSGTEEPAVAPPHVGFDVTDMAMERGSVAPSAAETVSEGDWLMAAIEDEGDVEVERQEEHMHDIDSDNLHDIDAEGEPDDYGEPHFLSDSDCATCEREARSHSFSLLILVFSLKAMIMMTRMFKLGWTMIRPISRWKIVTVLAARPMEMVVGTRVRVLLVLLPQIMLS